MELEKNAINPNAKATAWRYLLKCWQETGDGCKAKVLGQIVKGICRAIYTLHYNNYLTYNQYDEMMIEVEKLPDEDDWSEYKWPADDTKSRIEFLQRMTDES